MTRRPSFARRAAVLAAGLLGAVAALPAAGGPPPEPLGPAGLDLSWTPERPTQGRLFTVRVDVAAGRRVSRLTGEVAGEELHFRATSDGAFESLAPVPVDVEGRLAVRVDAFFADGGAASDTAEVPVTPGAFSHEHLTVAPRFGAPLDSADQARFERDQARAREVSRRAHRTERLWRNVVLPRNDRVTSGFGNGREFNGQISSRHLGLDLHGEVGDTVVAAARGVVTVVDAFLLAGNVVYLNHGAGLLSGYFHLSRALVAEGDTVEVGTPIGLVGATGRVTGPHLHWVVRYGTTSVDPGSLLELGR